MKKYGFKYIFHGHQFWFSFNFFSPTLPAISPILLACEAADCIMLGAAAVLPAEFVVLAMVPAIPAGVLTAAVDIVRSAPFSEAPANAPPSPLKPELIKLPAIFAPAALTAAVPDGVLPLATSPPADEAAPTAPLTAAWRSTACPTVILPFTAAPVSTAPEPAVNAPPTADMATSVLLIGCCG